MKKCLFLFLIALFLALVCGTLSLATGAASQDNASKKEEKPNCLGCHGPFEKLTTLPKDYAMPSGEKVSPHRYVPHADKKDIPDCTECHTPHPVPIEDKSKVVRPKPEYCYTGCHHQQNLQACSNCH